MDLCLAENIKFPPCIIVKLDGARHTIDAGLPPDHILTMYHQLSCTEENLSSAVMNSLVDQVHALCSAATYCDSTLPKIIAPGMA